MSINAAINRKAVDLAKESVEMTTAAGSGHPSTALSLAHLVTTLLYHQMRWDPKDPWNPAADRLVLSEGHAVPILYAAMADLGVVIGQDKAHAHPMTKEEANTLRAIDSPIDGHPNPGLGVHFFDAATGSLGQGLSVAAGLAAAARMDKVDRDIYCLIGDGEAREGQIWEAMDFLADHVLTNCVPIFNCNQLAQSDWVSPQQSSEVIARKAEAYGFIARIVDGHNPEQLRKTFNELHVVKNGSKPLAVIARTVKGWGTELEQGTGKHGHPVKKENKQAVFNELEATAQDLGVAGYKVNGELAITPPSPFNPGAERSATPRSAAPDSPPIHVDFEKGLSEANLLKDYHSGKPLATRQAYGAALLALGLADRRIVGLDADVKNSTYSQWLYQRLPNQFLECRIAEQNMFSVAVGVAAAGKIPFASTFAKFVVRAYDQIEMGINTGANFKVVGSHAGVTLAADGPSQMSLPDVAFFRSFTHVKNYYGQPAVRYFFPSDPVSCFKATELMANLRGCCYLRTLRAALPALYKSSDTFEVGGWKVLREGKDVVLVTAGYMVHECLRAADELSKAGKHATVIDAYSLPLNADGILEIARRNGGRIITVEDNYTGGLDAELAIAIADRGAEVRLTPFDATRIPKSGHEPEDVLAYLDLDYRKIAAAV